MEDIEIARSKKLKNILSIAKKLDLSSNNIEQYGKYKAKIANVEQIKYSKERKISFGNCDKSDTFG